MLEESRSTSDEEEEELTRVSSQSRDTSPRSRDSTSPRDSIEIIGDEHVQESTEDSTAQMQVATEFGNHNNDSVRVVIEEDEEKEDGESNHVTSLQEQLTDHVTSVLDGKQIEEAAKTVTDLSVICRALRVLIVMQISVMFQYLKRKAIKYTNNDRLRPMRVFVKKQYGMVSKHYSNTVKPHIQSNGKVLCGASIVLATWTVFFILYYQLFMNSDYLEHSFEGPSKAPPIYGPFYKRHVASREKASLKEESMKAHRFNSFLSNQLPVNRDIPDTRSQGCPALLYPHNLPAASVIVVFHNEALTVLLRTVHSILIRTPPRLLTEIILVDDFSANDELASLDAEIAKLPKTRHVRLDERSGLIKARLFGAARATGEVMIFLDSHCECNKGWIEPLLAEVKKDRTTVPSPIIDVIQFENFEYRQAAPQVGAFDWSFNFYWQLREQEGNLTAPLVAPVMAGGLFAIDRKYFYEVGSYDTSMNIWGGENMEMSFRIWMCGGRLLSLPCSRVGHIFRDRAPYNFGGQSVTMTLYRNYARAVEVWLDDHKDLFYRFVPLAKDVDVGDISGRVALRKKLQCKSFDWYLKNLLPALPTESRLLASGQIRNTKINQCVDTLGKRSANDTVTHYRCLPTREVGYTSQVWMYSKKYELISLENCMDAYVEDPDDISFKRVSLYPCHGMGGNQKWHYSPTKQLIHEPSQLCLSVGDPRHPKLFLDKCSGSAHQVFTFTNIYIRDDFDF